jgi:hypothetical protein
MYLVCKLIHVYNIDYAGGGPSYKGQGFESSMTKLALNDKSLIPKRNRVSAFKETYVYSRFTKEGNHLDEFNQQKLGKSVKYM